MVSIDSQTEKTVRLKRLLRRNANGIAVESMVRQGLLYRENWGVPIHIVRDIASRFAPDHEFAKNLYGLPLRELRLAACMIAVPDEVSEDELDFWAAGVDNPEIAEHLAFSLLSRTSLDRRLVDNWLNSSANTSVMLRYCAILALGRMVLLQNTSLPKDRIVAAISDVVRDDSVLLASAAENMLLRLEPDTDDL